MKLRVLGSSSLGNCYLLENDGECLILEAGIPFKEVKKALDFNISKIVGVFVTHEHGDHAGYLKDYKNTGIDIYASDGTMEGLDIGYSILKPGQLSRVGNFSIMPFRTFHDAREPLGFLVRHKDMGSLVFATDTYYIEHTFPNVNHIMVECNYSYSILNDRDLHDNLKARIIKSHFSLENVKEFLKANSSKHLKNVVLLHLSDRNSNAKQFKRECEEITGKATHIAETGLTIKFNLAPF